MRVSSLQYLNAGPGGIAGAFVHNVHIGERRHHFAGWWGVKLSERFKMEHVAEFMPGKYYFYKIKASIPTPPMYIYRH